METERADAPLGAPTARLLAPAARLVAARLVAAREWLHRPVDPTPLVVFRVGFGVLMVAAAIRFLAKGWVQAQYIAPSFHFRYYLLEWIPQLPGASLYLVFGLQIACASLIAFGWHYRAATIGFFLAFSYVEILDQTTYLNHYYFISLVSFLLILLPLHRWGSVSASLGRRDEATRPARWIPLALQVQIAIVYVFAGLAKLSSDWLLDAQPLSIWLAARSGFPLVGGLFDQQWFAYVMSWGGATFDLSVPALLFWRRSRPWAYLAVVGFHLATALLFPIGVFPWVMILGTLVFFDAKDYSRAFGRAHSLPLFGRARSLFLVDRAPTLRPNPRGVPRSRAATAVPSGLRLALFAFFALQLLVPLRHLAYPGSVLWTEEGYRFSWRVMLVEKTGTVIFAVTDPATGRSWDVFPADHLTPQQERQLSYQPDMILGFAHYLRDSLAESGVRDPEIRARAHVSLNGRRSRPLVDPNVDLARVSRSLAPKRWILPESGG